MSLGSLWQDVSLFQAGIGDEIFFGGSSLDGMLKVFFGRFSTEILEFYLNLKVRVVSIYLPDPWGNDPILTCAIFFPMGWWLKPPSSKGCDGIG